jgi:acetyl-CoA carboxylase biotin carboxylase subunit
MGGGFACRSVVFRSVAAGAPLAELIVEEETATLFRKVLVANRGEIALRILRTLREMRVPSVAVYSEADRSSPHLDHADEAYLLGPAPVSESYLSADRVLGVARRAGCDALIPGYGFLSENAAFARRCASEGVVFVGPNADAIEIMGRKPEARAHMAKAGVPIVPGGPASTLEQARATAGKVGYPVMFKAAAGGGGRGMRRVASGGELASNFERAQREALSSFGDGTIYIEKEVTHARHVEVQVLGDRHGGLVHLFERDCSVQRRHQKVVEESPSPHLPRAALEGLCETAVRGARSVNYDSVGTFEFLVDREHNFYFLEMNTRLQVEHPITELCTGLDLVREMLRVAAGEALGYGQPQIGRRGHAIECRIYAEDPSKNFLPSPGPVEYLSAPEGPGIRHDAGVCAGYRMGFDYDAMIAKLCAWAPTREHAVARMRRALAEYDIRGLTTNLDFQRRLLEVDAFVTGHYDTGFIEEHRDQLLGTAPLTEVDEQMAAAVLAVALHERESAAPARPGAHATSEGSAALASEWALAHRRQRLRY